MSVVNPPASAETDRPVGATPSVARRVLVGALATVLVGLVAGLVWLWLANPAQWEVRTDGIVMTEAAARGQFSVIVVFVIVGAVVSLACGWALVRMLPDLGWLLVPAIVLMTSIAAVIAWRVGVELGPPPPATLTGVEVGDRLPAQLAVDTVAPFVAWPIFGLLGLMVATWAGDRRVSERSGPPRPE